MSGRQCRFSLYTDIQRGLSLLHVYGRHQRVALVD